MKIMCAIGDPSTFQPAPEETARMSRTFRMLRLLADGQPRTVAEIGAALGVSSQQIRDSIQNLRKSGDILSLSVPYTITAEGRTSLSRRETVFARVKVRAEQKAVRKVKAPKVRRASPAESITNNALAHRHVLHSIWG